MAKSVFLPLVILLVLTSGCGWAITNRMRSQGLAAFSGSTGALIIDPGHGGHDSGAFHHHLQEKELALDIGKRVRRYLQGSRLEVVMTHDTDRFIPLDSRAALANRLRAQLFVSIHINANTDPEVSGAEVYYPRESVIPLTAPWPAFVQPTDVGTSSNLVKQILWDMVMTRQRFWAQQLASSICGSLQESLSVGCVTKEARFVVLREAWMPAVLVEVGYVSNRAEAKRLEQESYREAAADAIARGVITYLQQRGSSSTVTDAPHSSAHRSF